MEVSTRIAFTRLRNGVEIDTSRLNYLGRNKMGYTYQTMAFDRNKQSVDRFTTRSFSIVGAQNDHLAVVRQAMRLRR